MSAISNESECAGGEVARLPSYSPRPNRPQVGAQLMVLQRWRPTGIATDGSAQLKKRGRAKAGIARRPRPLEYAPEFLHVRP